MRAPAVWQVILSRADLFHRWKVWPRLASVAMFLAKHIPR
jgi:hypothetical protein